MSPRFLGELGLGSWQMYKFFRFYIASYVAGFTAPIVVLGSKRGKGKVAYAFAVPEFPNKVNPFFMSVLSDKIGKESVGTGKCLVRQCD